MIKLRREILLAVFKIFDMIIFVISFLATSSIVYGSNELNITFLGMFLQRSVLIQDLFFPLAILYLCHLVFLIFGLYQSKRFSSMRSEIKDIVKANFFFSLILYLTLLIVNSSYAQFIFILSFNICVTIIMIIVRIIMRGFLKAVRKRGRNLRHLLIVGTNKKAILLADKLESTPELGYVITGFVDDKWEGVEKFEKSGYNIVTDSEGFGEYIKTNIIDEVLVSLPVKSKYEKIIHIMDICEKHGIIVRNIPNIFNAKSSNFKMEYLEGESFSTYYTGAMNGWQLMIKWLLDRTLAFLSLILLSPVFIIVATIIKLNSSGPVFFVQERIGLNKRKFQIYKFRTMYENAEKMQADLENLNEVDGAAFKIENDPRITKIGKFLRKFSIDEIPQIINVLKTDMSFVGPRPLPVRDYNGFDIDWHRRRFSVRPGITCLWQVNGRHNIPFKEWMEMDVEYIDKWSLMMDA
ncbi:MAG: sugar transferase, partial [Desulfobacterales bacterium]|nr:sugar transferase [Desulfobacterales bacterium]